MVPEYTPSDEIRSLLEVDRHDVCLGYRQESAGLSLVAEEKGA
jgi:hypothetical protein